MRTTSNVCCFDLSFTPKVAAASAHLMLRWYSVNVGPGEFAVEVGFPDALSGPCASDRVERSP